MATRFLRPRLPEWIWIVDRKLLQIRSLLGRPIKKADAGKMHGRVNVTEQLSSYQGGLAPGSFVVWQILTDGIVATNVMDVQKVSRHHKLNAEKMTKFPLETAYSAPTIAASRCWFLSRAE